MTATLPVCVRVIAMSPRFIVVISVTNSNYHKPFLSSSRRWTLLTRHSCLKSTTFLRTRQPSEADGQIDERRRTVALDPQYRCVVVEGCMGSIPVHFAWSRDLYRSAAVTFTVDAALQLLAAAAGSGWPEGLYIRQTGFTYHKDHTLGSTGPDA